MTPAEPALCQYCETQPALTGSVYCCEGCEFLAGLNPKRPRLLPKSEENTDLLKHFGQIQGSVSAFECSVEPLACEACLQGLARLPELFPEVKDLSWNRNDSVLRFEFLKGKEIPSEIFQFLEKLKLSPRWRKLDEERQQRKTHRKQLLRIGLTGAIAGNLMLFSIPIYGGLEGSLQVWFEWIQFVLFLPVLFWTALPFYRTAWASIRLRQLSLDLPLTVAFLSGSLLSIYSLLKGTHQIYFDSLAGFLFLIQTSRWLLERSLSRHLDQPRLHQFFEKSLFQVNGADWVPVDQIQKDDQLTLKAGDRVPADGILMTEAAQIETSWMNGEVEASLRLKNSEVQAGTRLLSNHAVLKVLRPLSETPFAQLVRQLDAPGEKLRTTEEARIGAFLVLTCFALTLALFMFGQHLGVDEILRRSVALLIVACPCAISFATPLARARASRIAMKRGFWVRDSLVWPRLLAPRKIAFDKTGTLTGHHLVLDPHSPMIDRRWKQIILTLENISRHPIAESLRRTWGPLPLLSIESAQETLGQGVSGWIDGKFYSLQTSKTNQDQFRLELFQNNEKVVEFELQEEIKTHLKQTLDDLKKDYSIFVISGDREQRVQKFAKQYSLPQEQVFGGVTPEEKRKKIEELQPDVYIGDGTNDLLALQKTPVSIAVGGASLEAQTASDIMMFDSNFRRLRDLFRIARETQKLNFRNFLIALTYNLSAGAAALLGMINPLWAALLMPLASLALLASTLWGTSLFRHWEKDL